MPQLTKPVSPYLNDLKRALSDKADPRTLKAFDDLFRAVPGDLNAIDARVTQNETDIAKTLPVYVSITSADSPYQASDMEYLLCDMSITDIDVLFPAEGRIWVSREGASNTLTMQETINGMVNPLILFDNTARSFAKIGENWRVMR
jgi:hypothetical protein